MAERDLRHHRPIFVGGLAISVLGVRDRGAREIVAGQRRGRAM